MSNLVDAFKHQTLNCIELNLLSHHSCFLSKFWFYVSLYVHCRKELPTVFATYFDENSLIHDYNTRQKIDFHTYSVHSEMRKKAIKYKAEKFGIVYLLLSKMSNTFSQN